MEIKINGKTFQSASGISLEKLLAEKGLKKERVAVSVNGKIVKPEEFAYLTLDEGDELDIVSFVGGG